MWATAIGAVGKLRATTSVAPVVGSSRLLTLIHFFNPKKIETGKNHEKMDRLFSNKYSAAGEIGDIQLYDGPCAPPARGMVVVVADRR